MASRQTVKRLKLAAILAAVPIAILSVGSPTIAGGANPGGSEFAQAAIEYREKALSASDAGNVEAAEIYNRLAEIKDGAARLADEGRWDEIDWSEYHDLNAELGDLS